MVDITPAELQKDDVYASTGTADSVATSSLTLALASVSPQNWPLLKRIWVTFVIALLNLYSGVASSILGTAQAQLEVEFGVSSELTILNTSLFLMGYVLGPPLFGPLSEKFGRRLPVVLGMLGCAVFTLMPALGQNIAVLFLGRFLSGLFGVAPLAVLGGVISDCWPQVHRVAAMGICMLIVFAAPTFGTIIGSFMNSCLGNWRWTMWLLVIAGAALSILTLVAMPETFSVILLEKKNKALGIPDEEVSKGRFDFRSFARIYLLRPWRLFFTQPILMLMTLYQSFTYGLVYLFYQSYAIAYGEDRGWNSEIASLPLLGLFIGASLGLVVTLLYNYTFYKKALIKNDGIVEPELRLPPMILGAAMLVIGLFWFAWTASPSINWVANLFAGLPIGFGILTITLQVFIYIIDCYAHIANSALAVNAFVRSLAGAGFPLFGRVMYHHLGVSWATTILAFFALMLAPVPLVFFYHGNKIRKWSKAY